MRMMVKLRVQNPNDAPVEDDGVYVKLEVLEKTFATSVSDERGSNPPFGEFIISVPVTVSRTGPGANSDRATSRPRLLESATAQLQGSGESAEGKPASQGAEPP